MDPTSKDPNASAPRRSMPELLENYEAEYARLVAQSRELARMRERVLDSAEREAAAIMADARHEVRRVLVNARRELVVLAAQLQAVGCNAPDLPGMVSPAAAPLPAAAPAASGDDAALEISRAVLGEGRRSIREVLLEARAELQAFSEEARELRERLAHEPATHEGGSGGAQLVVVPATAASAADWRRDPADHAGQDEASSPLAIPEATARVGPRWAPEEPDRAAADTRSPVAASASAPTHGHSAADPFIEQSSLPEFPSEAHPTAPPALPPPHARRPDDDWMSPPSTHRGELPPRGLFSGDAPGATRARRRAILAVVIGLFLLVLLGLGVSRALDGYDAAAGVQADPATPPAAPPADAPEALTSAPQPAPSPSPTGTRGTPGGVPLSIRMEVIRPSWIRTTLDGRPDTGRLYRAGETWTVSATDSVLLRAGDAGAVRVSVNGAAAEPLGADGQVVTRRFTRPGAERPAPATGVPSAAAPEAARPDPAPASLADPLPQQTRSAVAAPAQIATSPTTAAPAAGTSPPPADIAPASATAASPAQEGTPGARSTAGADAAPPPVPPAADAAGAPVRAAGTDAAAAVPAEGSRSAEREPAAEQEIRRLTQQWFNAYFAGERASSGADQPAVVDLRPPASRTADRSRRAAERVLKAVHVEVAGTGGVLSGRVETAGGAEGPVRVTLVSAVWTFQNGRWSLVAARLAEPAAAAAVRP